MSIEVNVQIVKDFFEAIGSRDKQRLLSLVLDDFEWINPGQGLAVGRQTLRARGIG